VNVEVEDVQDARPVFDGPLSVVVDENTQQVRQGLKQHVFVHIFQLLSIFIFPYDGFKLLTKQKYRLTL